MISASPQIYSGHKTKQDERAGRITHVGEYRYQSWVLVQNPLKSRDIVHVVCLICLVYIYVSFKVLVCMLLVGLHVW
jgi:hypothetical protein